MYAKYGRIRLIPSSEIAQAVQWLAVDIPIRISLGISKADATREIAFSFIGLISADSSDQNVMGLNLSRYSTNWSGMVAISGTMALALDWSRIEAATALCM